MENPTPEDFVEHYNQYDKYDYDLDEEATWEVKTNAWDRGMKSRRIGIVRGTLRQAIEWGLQQDKFYVYGFGPINKIDYEEEVIDLRNNEWSEDHPLHRLWDNLDFLANSEVSFSEQGYRKEIAKERDRLGEYLQEEEGVAPSSSKRLHHNVPNYEE